MSMRKRKEIQKVLWQECDSIDSDRYQHPVYGDRMLIFFFYGKVLEFLRRKTMVCGSNMVRM